MRSTPLLLLLLAALAGLGFFYLRGDSSADVDLQNVDQQTELSGVESGDLPEIQVGQGSSSGARTEVVDPQGTVVKSGTLTTEELTSLDANALLGRVLDEEGKGLPDVDVRFLAGGLAQFRQVGGVGLDWADMPAAKTNQQGDFRFEGLPGGERHLLRVYHPRIALVFVDGVTVADFGETSEPPITLRYGKRLRGVVTNELDLPLAGVQLHLDGQWRPADPRPSHDRLSAVTDSEGAYEIFGVPDGARCLTAVAKAMGTVTRIQSLIFSDTTGQAHLVNLKMKGASQLEGRITDLDGNGIANINLLAVDRKAYRDVDNDRTVSLADGSFSFSNLGRGTYQITAGAPGYTTVVKANVTAPTANLNIILGDQQLITGRVVDGVSGKGLAGSFELQLLFYQRGKDGPAIPRGAPYKVSQSTNGAFSLPFSGASGLWGVQATARGFATSVSEPFDFGGGETGSDVVVSMTQGGTLRGLLVDAAGNPVVGGRISTQDNAWTDDAFSQMVGAEEGTIATVTEARSGRDGSFELPNLRPATYQVIARSASLHLQKRSDLVVAEGSDLDIGSVVLLAGGSLHGTLLDAEADPTAGGMVFLNPVDTSSGMTVRRCKSDFAGHWKIRNIIPGTYLLSGKEPTSETDNPFGVFPSAGGNQVVVIGGMDDQRDVHLEGWTKPKPPAPKPPTGQLSGKLTDSAGIGLVGVQIKLVPFSEGASPTRLIKSAREGSFSIINLLPGDYDLSILDSPEAAERVTIFIDSWTIQDLQQQ